MRAPLFFIIGTAALVGGATWFALRERAPARAERADGLAAIEGGALMPLGSDLDASPRERASDVAPQVARAEVLPASEEAPPAPLGRGVRVRVRDAAGAPLAGVPVALLPREDAESEPSGRRLVFRSLDADGRPSEKGLIAQTSALVVALTRGAEGEAFLPYAPKQGGRASAPAALRVACATCADDPGVEVEPGDPPPVYELQVRNEPVLEVRAIGVEIWWIEVEFALPAGEVGAQNIQAVPRPLMLCSGERLRLPHRPDAPPIIRARIHAPLAPYFTPAPEPAPHGGTIELDERELLCTATLRVLGLDGAPWCDTNISASLQDGDEELQSMQHAKLRTDAEGRVRFWLRAGPPASAVRSLRLTLPIDRGPASHPVERWKAQHPDDGEAHLDLSRSFAAGAEHDLGSLRQGDGPLLLSGRVVDLAGQPVPHAGVRCRGEELRCDADGRFERRGIAPAEAVSIEAFAANFAQREPRPVHLPAHDLELVLEPNGKLRFRLELPEGLDPGSLAVVAAHRSGIGDDATWKTLRTERPHGGRAAFAFEDLALTTYRFSIRYRRVELHGFELEMASGEQDLGAIDLREQVQPLRFQLAATLGPKERVTLQLFAREEAEEPIVMGPGALGVLDLWIPRRIDRWVLSAEGRTHEGRCDQGLPIVIR